MAPGDITVRTPGLTRQFALVLIALLLGVVAGLSALIGAAAITDRIPLFLLAGLLVFCLMYLLALVLATRGIALSSRGRVRAFAFFAGVTAVVGAFTATTLRPLDDPRLPPAPVQGQRFWELPTGSRIACVRLAAAAYAAASPEHVAKIVLSSPADPAPAVRGASMVGRLSLRDRLAVYALLLQPRALLSYALLQVNPRAAYAFAGDAEMDARFDRVYNRTRPALHCAGKPPGPPLNGLGFYAHYYPQSPASPPHSDFLPGLAEQTIPALVIKGRCDYLSWSSAMAYLMALPDARLAYLMEAGHNAYQDEPERFLAAVRAFLLDQPLPDSPYTGRRPPDDFEGPP
jgi:hypothetical protein